MSKIKRRNIAPFCECSCGEHVTKHTQKPRWNKYINHHAGIKYHVKDLGSKLCACGCGEYFKINKYYQQQKFIIGHFSKLIIHTPESNKKTSESLIGRTITWGDKISKAKKGVPNPKLSKYLTGRTLSKETIEKIILKKTGVPQSDESKIAKQISVKAYWDSLPQEDKIKRLNHMISDEGREEASERMLKNWENPEYREKTLSAQFKGRQIFPNKPETIILNLLNEKYPNEWRYTGDGTIWINGKNPDFTNEKDKKLIEFYGEYFHKGGKKEEQNRINIFKPAGYDTLVIWESELKDIDKVKNRINKFVR